MWCESIQVSDLSFGRNRDLRFQRMELNGSRRKILARLNIIKMRLLEVSRREGGYDNGLEPRDAFQTVSAADSNGGCDLVKSGGI